MPERDDALYRADQVRELDRIAIEDQAIPGFTLMRRAAAAAWRELRGQWPAAKQVIVFCGPGNNGGDGFEVGRLALADGVAVRLLLAASADDLRGDARTAYDRVVDAGAAVAELNHEPGAAAAVCDALAISSDTVLVDALLGTGVDRPLEGLFADLVDWINAVRPRVAGVLAVDLPSGLHADSGRRLAHTVQADVTVSFIGNKLGVYTGAGPACAGRRCFDDLAVPDEVYADVEPVAWRIAADLARRLLPLRARDAFKNRHGHVLVVGGEQGMSGAALMTAQAAFRSGAGLLSVATRVSHATALTAACPPLMCHGVESIDELDALLAQTSVVAVGPGLGQNAWGRAMWNHLRLVPKPMVVDADALNLMASWAHGDQAGRSSVAFDSAHPRVLTPHPGEAARLLDTTPADIEQDRLAAVRALSEKFGASVVLKGAGSLICSPGQVVQVCANGNPGMAVAGMGDMLTGIVAGLLAQGLSAHDAATLAVDLHARAGDLAATNGERGMIATDLLDPLRALVNPA